MAKETCYAADCAEEYSSFKVFLIWDEKLCYTNSNSFT